MNDYFLLGGASSMYVIDYTKREKRDKDLNRTPPQYKVSVCTNFILFLLFIIYYQSIH